MWFNLVALCCCISATSISANQIIQHLRHFHQPEFQLYICRIILMVPIYSVQSYVSYNFPEFGVFLDTVRDCYEAYVLYIFLSLLINYLGGEPVIVLHFEMLGRIAHPWPLKNFLRPITADRNFFRFVKKGVLQFVFVKPICAVAALFLEGFDLYGGGRFDPSKGFMYVVVVTNTSVWIAMYSLVLFYLATEKRLAPFRPLAKFLCIKAVIFFSFWQSTILAALVQLGFFAPQPTTTGGGLLPDGTAAPVVVETLDPHASVRVARHVALSIVDWLICIEMLGFSIAHSFAFSYRDFVSPDSRQNKPLLLNLQKVLNVEDVLRDAHETFWNPGEAKDVPLKDIASSVQRFSMASGDSDDEELAGLVGHEA